MSETIDWDDMRLFAKVAEHGSMTRAATAVALPKQTVSRRVARLEAALGVQLMHRTTRSVKLTEAGAQYAARCAELSRMAAEANRAAMDANEVPQGTLAVTADPVFGEAFLGPLIVDYGRRWPATRVTVSLTRRHVDLVEEGFDVAFRIGNVDHPSLSGVRLGPARVRYCASPKYVARRGALPKDGRLEGHDCLFVGADDAQPRWPMPKPGGGIDLVTVSPRMRMSSLAIAREAALAGLGIALFPEFACAEDLVRRRLVDAFGDRPVEVGSVWLLHPTRKFLPKRVTAFIDLARSHFATAQPWVVPANRTASTARR
jgi:DNA-binding transcriptional LysR family regulator